MFFNWRFYVVLAIAIAGWLGIIHTARLALESLEQPLEAQATFNAGRVTVNTTATPIWTAPASAARVMVRFCNRHTTPIFVGPSTVTTANGFEIINATCEEFAAFRGATIYGIVAAATARVDYAVKDYIR